MANRRMAPGCSLMYFHFWKIFCKSGICISKPALEMTLYIATRAMILWGGLGCTVSWDRNGLPEFQIFMGLIRESLVEDILHSCNFWRSQIFAFVSEESGLILVSFFRSCFTSGWCYHRYGLSDLGGEISPTFFQKRSHDFKDHFFLTSMHSACWCMRQSWLTWTFLPFLVKLKAGNIGLEPMSVGWFLKEAMGKNIPSLIIASLKLELKIVNP